MSQEALDRITDKVMAHNPNPPEEPPKVIAGGADRPLQIGEVELQCYVLENELRVFSQRGMLQGVGLPRGGARKPSDSTGAQIPRFATQKWIKDYISNDLLLALKNPILFRLPTGFVAYGYPATVLVDLCAAILEANDWGATTARQDPIVEKARLLHRGFARVGVIALVDEATGYQQVREERALATILEKFIAKELQEWTRTFPMEFYQQMCRLKKWPEISAVKRPSVIGRYTNDIVYDRLAPGVLEELRRLNPLIPEKKRRLHKHHQWLTPDLGHPALQRHLWAIIALMRAANSWHVFSRNLDRAFPRQYQAMHLDLEDE